MRKDLEDLEIFQLAEEVADEIYNLVVKFEWLEKKTVGVQLIQAADSIGANISEGYGRYHYNETVTFLYYARGSLKESQWWLRRSLERGFITEEIYEGLNEKLDLLGKQINGYISYLKDKKSQSTNQ
jgi:four helix bundle protein